MDNMMLYAILKSKSNRQNRKQQTVLETSDTMKEEAIAEEVIEETMIMPMSLDDGQTEEEIITEIPQATEEEVVYEYEIITIDGNLKWQNSAPLGDYREFRCVGFDEKPTYLTEDALYDETLFMPFNEENVAVLDVDSDFTINSKEEPDGECIFVSNGVLYIHVSASDVQTGKGMTYAKSFKQYLANNPITLKIRKI